MNLETVLSTCRACEDTMYVFHNEKMCLKCGVLFEVWLEEEGKLLPEMYDSVMTFMLNFNEASTRVALDEWLEKGMP